MADAQSSMISSTAPPPAPPHGDNLPMLYYGLVVVGTAAAVLAMYNLIIIRWCTGDSGADSGQSLSSSRPSSTSPLGDGDISGSNWGLSFKYKKGSSELCDLKDDDGKPRVQRHENTEQECSVCLSAFEDGEEVSELSRCKHSFHAQCIGMWLYSHFDCPLCRERVEIVSGHRDAVSVNGGGGGGGWV